MTENRFPPGPRGNRLVGRMVASSRHDPLNFITDVAREYGDISSFQIGFNRIFLLNHPDYVKDVMVNHYEFFLKGSGNQRMNRFVGEGILLSEGDKHRQRRQMLQPSFHRQRLAAYANVAAEYGERFSERWQREVVIDVAQEMQRLTLAIIGRTLFNADVESKSDQVGQAMMAATLQFRAFKLPFSRLLERLPLPHIRRFHQGQNRLREIVYHLIEERRRDGLDYGDMLSMLIRTQGQGADGEGLTDLQVWDEALTIFIAGYDTLSLALMWTWYLLSQNPRVEAKLHAEVDAVLDGARPPTFEDLHELRYTGMVLTEAMRLYPPIWRLVRRAIKDFRVGGYVIPAGSLVMVSQYVMHRDPRYFSDPLRFDPERWTPEAKAARPQYCYFPFGGGARRCIGEGFALMEGVLLLAALARHWRLRLSPGHPVELHPLHMLRSRYGMMMKLERRTDVSRGGRPLPKRSIGAQCPMGMESAKA